MPRGSSTYLGLLVLASGLLAGGALGQAAAKRATQQEGTTASNQRPRIPIPGVGGAAPARKKAAPGARVPSAGPLIGPLLPGNPSAFPAPVLGPGQNPGLPGLPGLQARQINPLLFGVALPPAFVPPGETADRTAPLLKGAGVTNVRLTMRWLDIERAKGKLDWQATDRSVRYVARQGFPIVATVMGLPSWTNQPGLPSAAVAADVERLGFSAASRYRGSVNLWEFWSEPDAGPAWPDSVPALRGVSGPSRSSSYISLLQAFTKGVKRANPAAQVAVGGLALHNTRFLSDLYQMGGRAYFDAVALHPAAPRDIVDLAWIDAIRGLMVKQGDAAKPIWVTDWGWSTATGRPDSVTELHQARLVRQSLAGMRDRPYIVLADYRSLADWRQREADPSAPASVMVTGLTSQALQPKPAYLAFREMATGFNPEAVARFARVSLVGALPLAQEAGVRGTAIQVQVDASKPSGPLPRLWEGVSQAYEPALPTLSTEIAAPLKAAGVKLVRFDPFPNPDWAMPDRIVVVEGTGGNSAAQTSPPGFTIRWQYADSMMDSLEAAGAKAMLDVATMPSGLSSPSGNPRMPRDLSAWSAWVRQVVRRYGSASRRPAAYWELSSEPNRGDFALEEWLRLYEAFARAVTAEDPRARVGGPSTAGFDETWLRGLAERCERDRIPLHFLSWHVYGRTVAEVSHQTETARGWLQSLKSVSNAELIVSEWSPAARPAAENDSLAGAARLATAMEGMLEGERGNPNHALYAAFREGPDPRRPSDRLAGRWGLLSHDGRPKASYNLLKLLDKLGPNRIPAASEETDIHALASRGADRVSVLVWSDPADADDSEQMDQPILLRFKGLPWLNGSRGEQWTLDPRHGDLSTAPARASLESAGRFSAPAGDVELPVILSPRSITLIELRPGGPSLLELSLEAPRYVVYGSSRVGLSARLRNPGTQQRRVELMLGGRDLAPGKQERVSVTLGPNEAKVVPLTARLVPGEPEGQRFFTVSASTGEAASTSIKTAPPLIARLDPSRLDVSAVSLAGISPAPAKFNLLLDNRSDAPAALGVAGGSTSVSVLVPARRTLTVPVVVPVPRGAEGIVATPIRIIQGGRAVETLTATVATRAPSHFAGLMPRINGDLSEWGDAEKLTLRPALRDRRGSFSSLSGLAMTLWDDHAFYLAVSISDAESDDGVRPASVEQSAANAPELQLSIGPAGLKAPASPIYNIDLARTGERMYRAAEGRGPGTIVPAARVFARRDGRRTVYEIAIPWTEVGGAIPRPGERLAFALRINSDKGQRRPGLEYAGAKVGDAPEQLPVLVLTKP